MKMSISQIVLILSLALNLILSGIFTGYLLKGNDRNPHQRDARSSSGIARLAPEERRVTLQIFREAIEAATPEREAYEAARKALNKTLNTPILDLTKVEQDFDRLRKADTAMREVMQKTFIAQMTDLSPAQRQFISRRMLSRGGRRGRGQRGGNHLPR